VLAADAEASFSAFLRSVANSRALGMNVMERNTKLTAVRTCARNVSKIHLLQSGKQTNEGSKVEVRPRQAGGGGELEYERGHNGAKAYAWVTVNTDRMFDRMSASAHPKCRMQYREAGWAYLRGRCSLGGVSGTDD
jgi:hypothetical protein